MRRIYEVYKALHMERFGEHLNSKNTTREANEEAENAKTNRLNTHIQNHNGIVLYSQAGWWLKPWKVWVLIERK